MAEGSINFVIQIPRHADLAALTDKVRRADDLGYAAVSFPDHLQPKSPNFAPLVTLAAIAGMSTRLRLATTVVDNDFRHPTMLAGEAATLDVLSDGRLDLGMGAGWIVPDYTTTGITSFDPPGVRFRRFVESFTLVRRLLAGETVTWAGDNYTVTDFTSYPRPVQEPFPITVGGRRRGMLAFAAREADTVNVLPIDGPGGNLLSSFARQHDWITEARGARSGLTIALRVPYGELASPGEHFRRPAERVAERTGMTADDVLDSPFMFVGDHSSVTDKVAELRERFGVTSFTVSEELGFELAPVVAA